MDLKGKLVQQMPIESGISREGKPWQKRVNIFDVPSGNYTDKLAVTFFGDQAKSELKVGLEYLLSLNIKSRAGDTGKWFTEAVIWRWVVVDGAANEAIDKSGVGKPKEQKFESPSAARNASVNAVIEEVPDLPFVWLIPIGGLLASASMFC